MRLGGVRLMVVLAVALASLSLLPVRLWWGALAVLLVRWVMARWFLNRLGGYTREKILAIMKDSRIGAVGVIGLVVGLGLKWQAVAALPAALVPALLVAGHALSRGAAATLMATLDYARPEGEPTKARALVMRLGGVRLAVVLAVALASLALLPVGLWWGALAVLLVRWVMARWYFNRLGGYTGDCIGAMQQVGELAFYLSALAFF